MMGDVMRRRLHRCRNLSHRGRVVTGRARVGCTHDLAHGRPDRAGHKREGQDEGTHRISIRERVKAALWISEPDRRRPSVGVPQVDH